MGEEEVIIEGSMRLREIAVGLQGLSELVYNLSSVWLHRLQPSLYF